MRNKQRLGVLSVALTALIAVAWMATAADKSDPKERHEALMKTYKDGNYKDAYEGLRKHAVDPKTDPVQVTQDLTTCISCLQQLGRVEEIDEFREAVVTAHSKQWKVLHAVALSYTRTERYGYIVAGTFYRGHKRGGQGRYVNVMERDRARALQLLTQAQDLTRTENDKGELAQFHVDFANVLLTGSGYHEPWRLQYITTLSELPDYEDGYRYYGRGNGKGAPVDEKGNVILHHVPKNYKEAGSDGERWRWHLAQAMEYNPARASEIDMHFATFLYGQFGPQTMAWWGFRGRGMQTQEKDQSGPYALHTLKETETIARTAMGVKRFSLPDEFNYIKVWERVAERGRSTYGESARDQLASEFENRRQYVKAAEGWRKSIEHYGVGDQRQREKRLDQIVGNWGRFEPGRHQVAGTKGNLDFRFRNGKKVSFEAHAIKVDKLLDDVKAYLKSNPGRLNWEELNITNIGHRLVEQNQAQYLGAKVAAWDAKLEPREGHYDELKTIAAPMTKPGAYLITADMDNGNTSRIVLWLNDSIIVKKPLENKSFLFVADASTGVPVAKADLEFFGYRTIYPNKNQNVWKVETKEFKGAADQEGQLLLGGDKVPTDHQWLITAKKAKDGPDGADRMAYLGFSHVWYGREYDPEYNATRAFVITDRPVYRPEQKVEFKAWVRHSKYDQPNVSEFAGKDFTVRIMNPKGEKAFEKTLKADEFGGINGTFDLTTGMTLGTYGMQIFEPGERRHYGYSSFRIEEYKKPEFEVLVDAPKEPVQLGEMVNAQVQAKYYFGAPVTSAKVKIKVERSAHNEQWYPRGDWDWFYGRGYWWFAPDMPWFPGWAEWCCCKRPYPIWWHHRADPPEIVYETEGAIGPDGTVKVPIDTAPAKAMHGDEDHAYTITAEVVDESRRTIVGSGKVLVARKPFKVHTWVDRGHYVAGDTIRGEFRAQTLDGKPVEGKGKLTLLKITYDDKNKPVETPVEKWEVDTNVEGYARQQLTAAKAGQYRLSYQLTDSKKHTIEGGYLFVVRGEGFTGKDYRFNDIELITDKREYKPGEKVKLLINSNQNDGTVLLFARPAGVYQPPQTLHLKGKSRAEEIDVVQRDMPNFYIEAVTVHGGKVHSEVREVIVPPEKRILNVEVVPSSKEYKPGQEAKVQIKVTDFNGKPYKGSLAVSIYDRSVEYISGGTNVPEIKEFFWKWRRHHNPQTETSLNHYLGNQLRRNEIGMGNIGVFGEMIFEDDAKNKQQGRGQGEAKGDAAAPPGKPGAEGPGGGGFGGGPADGKDRADKNGLERENRKKANDPGAAPGSGEQPGVRKNFADTALWVATLSTDQDGIAEVKLKMPENLTGWKIKTWAMGHGTTVGEGAVEVTTKKDLLVRLQAPRFFVEKDEVVLSANVHNYLKKEKKTTVTLDVEGGTLKILGSAEQQVTIPVNGEKRVDWRVKVTGEGKATVRMKAVTDEESDAMQMTFPCFVHGMLKMDSFSGVIRPDKDKAMVTMTVPKERRINETRLEVRYSPTLAGAMVDALPYLVDYSYGCTEQTLNRFLPTVITQRILLDMKLDLKDIQKKRTNLNAQEIGDPKKRAEGWKRYERNPVFDQDEVRKMTAAGVQRLIDMQCSDGGWGWFSGNGEQSYPHTTAVVVHGLQIALQNGAIITPGVIERGVEWLKNHQAAEVRKIQNAPTKTLPWKEHADALDALCYMVLVDASVVNGDMREFLYRDRTKIPVYSKAMFGLALFKEGQDQADKLGMILKNISQYVVQDEENQTAFLRLPADNYWWYWYGSEIEANAYYLKLLAKTNPKDQLGSRMVKYLLNNRKHATYWNSTRDTAVAIEAMADYLRASGEDRPDMTIEVWLDGKKQKDVKVNAENLFSFDNTFVLGGDAVESGERKLEIRKKGTGPVYFNAYLTNFTLEDHITRAGLEVKVNRKYYKLERVAKTTKVPGERGQPLDQKVEKFKRIELANLAQLKSGDLVEVELEIDSKNDYEYLCFEDPKAAGFEAVLVRSGYGNDMGAYMEVRDDKVCFFARTLARGKHSVSYRLRAEIPGKFSALPTRGYAMYAPELKGNSDEIKLTIED